MILFLDDAVLGAGIDAEGATHAFFLNHDSHVESLPLDLPAGRRKVLPLLSLVLSCSPERSKVPRRRSLFGFEPKLDRDDLKGSSAGEDAITVSALNAMVRQNLETEFPRLRVLGEISNCVRAASGHFYFTLKDEDAQISAAMWRSQAGRLRFDPADGQAVMATGKLSLYVPRGNFQIIVDKLEEAGQGSLEAQLKALEAHYEKLGYFSPESKQPLPFLPQTVGIVTSVAGAAIHDILRSMLERFPKAKVLVAPVRVQGRGSAEEIAAAIGRLNAMSACDVMIVGRGGGSLEDLWAFNEAPVIEAIYQSKIPVISAVGHEVDVTLADLVADVRALTPTAAGEIVIPDLDDLESFLAKSKTRLDRRLGEHLERTRSRLEMTAKSWALREPSNILRRVEQRLDELQRFLPQNLNAKLLREGQRLASLRASAAFVVPQRQVLRTGEFLNRCETRLSHEIKARLDRVVQALEKHRRLLAGLSPLAVLDRGYSLTRRQSDGRVVHKVTELQEGEKILTRFASGETISRVERIEETPEDGN